MDAGMEREENAVNKRLYKITIGVLKILPVLLSICSFLTVLCGLCGLRCDILSLVGGVSLIPLVFLYLSSYVFRFCVYHRMFLHYVTINELINLYDYYIGIPLTNRGLFGLYLMVACVSLLYILYYYYEEKCCRR